MQLPLDLPPTDDDLFGYTTCAVCNRTIPTVTAIVMVRHIGRQTDQEHVCSHECGVAFHLSSVRTLL